MSLNPADYRSAVRACIAAGLATAPAPEIRPVRVTPPGPCSHRPPLGKRQEASGAALDAILDRALAVPYSGGSLARMRLAVEANMPMARFRVEMAKRKAGKAPSKQA